MDSYTQLVSDAAQEIKTYMTTLRQNRPLCEVRCCALAMPYILIDHQMIAGNEILTANYLESQAKEIFITEIGPYVEQAKTNHELQTFLSRSSALWSEIWPLRLSDFHEDPEAYECEKAKRIEVRPYTLVLTTYLNA